MFLVRSVSSAAVGATVYLTLPPEISLGVGAVGLVGVGGLQWYVSKLLELEVREMIAFVLYPRQRCRLVGLSTVIPREKKRPITKHHPNAQCGRILSADGLNTLFQLRYSGQVCPSASLFCVAPRLIARDPCYFVSANSRHGALRSTCCFLPLLVASCPTHLVLVVRW